MAGQSSDLSRSRRWTLVRNIDRLEGACVGAGGACGLLMLATTDTRHYPVG